MANGTIEKASLLGGLAAAVVASLCCIAPLVFVSVGISGAWIANLVAFEPYRPYALAVGLGCIALGYRSVYRAPPPEACAPGTLCAVPAARREGDVLDHVG